MTFSLPVLALAASALLALVLAVFILSRLRTPDSISLGLMAVTIVFWSAGYAIELGAISFEHKILGTQIALVGYTFAPYLWFLFVLEFSRKANQRRLFMPYWLGLVPLVDLAVLWFGGAYRFAIFHPRLEAWGDMLLLVYSYGPWWFWGHTAVGFMFSLAGIGILIYHLWLKSSLRRAQNVALLVAGFLPTVGSAFYFAYGLPIDPTAILFTLTIGIIFFAVFRYDLINISPIARDLVVDALRDGLIVVDLQQRIVDVNASAARIIGLEPQQIIGKPLTDALQPWPSLLERFRKVTEIGAEIDAEIDDVVALGAGQAVRQVGVRSNVLYDRFKRPIGCIIRFLEMDPILPHPRATFDIKRPAVESSAGTPSVLPEVSPAFSILYAIKRFFYPPATKTTSYLDSGLQWDQTIERMFTTIVRVLAVLGTIALLLALPSYLKTEAGFFATLGSLIAAFWVLGLARQLPYGLRISVFFFAVYALTLRELLNYGYSPEGFALSLACVALATLLAGLRGGQISFAIILATLVGLGVLIGAKWYHPPLLPTPFALPYSLLNFVQSIAVFTVLAGGLAIAVYALLGNLSRAYQEGVQAHNLLQQERDLLEQRVLERTLDLAHARDQALEASRFKSQLLSRVSHDLRSPLTGVLGYAELLEDGVYGELNAKQHDVTNKIITSATYLKTMINELLDQAQLDARAVKINRAPFEPAHLLESVKTSLSVLASQKGLSLVSELDPTLPISLIGDELRLQQVVFNLVGNAIKFTEKGEVRISLAKASESNWTISVVDTGAGIPGDAQELIFESFRQLDNAITRKSRGTGLGLSITKQLVELMGGTIELQSEVGRGSIFTVILALQAQPQENHNLNAHNIDAHNIDAQVVC